MLTLLSLCALAALCAADSSPEADAQFNYGGQGGNNYYQPPQPRHYGSGGGKGGGCRDKKCTKTIEVTQTSFKSTSKEHEYNTIFPVTSTTVSTSYSWTDKTITKPACSKIESTITHYEFYPSTTEKVIHECYPTLKLKTFTNWYPVTLTKVINQCQSTSNEFTVQSIDSTVFPTVITTVGFGSTHETKTHWTPVTTRWEIPICDEVSKCKTPDKPSHYPATPAYGYH